MKLKLAMMFLCILMICGCSKSETLSEYDKVHKKLMALESYSADVTVKYISNKGENAYKVKQYARSDGKYRMETLEPQDFNGCVLLYDGKMVWQYTPSLEDNKIKVNAPDKPERAEVVLFSFVENYVKSKDVGVTASSIDESLCTVLEAKITGGNKFLDNEKLWLDNETQLPKQLIIYDKDGNEKIVVNYENFEYNCKIDDSKFVLKN